MKKHSKDASIFSLIIGIGLSTNAVYAESIFDSVSVDLAATSRFYLQDMDSNVQTLQNNQAKPRKLSYGSRLELKFNHKYQDVKFGARILGNWDKVDIERRYVDIREASAYKSWDDISVGGGIDTFFWGVSESINLINVLNQSDVIASLDGKVKLGQTFVSLHHRIFNGDIKVYYLPTFRERSFPQRPSFGGQIVHTCIFEDDNKRGGIAARGVFYHNNVEFSLGYFKGTRRDPLFIKLSSKQAQLIPYYLQTENYLFDGVYLGTDATYKLEIKTGKEQSKGFFASNIGIEYPIFSLPTILQDLVLIAEYVFDDRGNTVESHGQNDIFIGTKFELTSSGNTQVRFLFSYDFDYKSQYAEISYQYRITDYVRIKAKMMGVLKDSTNDLRLHPLANEEFIKMSIHYAF